MSIDFSDKMAGDVQKQLQILVIMAHPADTFDHCGGTMAHHIERGDKVTVVGMYQGVHIHDEVIADQMRLSGTTLTDEEAEKLRDTREDVKNKDALANPESLDAVKADGLAAVWRIAGDDPAACNTVEAQAVAIDGPRETPFDGTLTLPPYSVNLYRVPLQ